MQHHCRRQSEVSRASFIYHRHRRDPHTAEYVSEWACVRQWIHRAATAAWRLPLIAMGMQCGTSSSSIRRSARHSRPAREDARQYVRFQFMVTSWKIDWWWWIYCNLESSSKSFNISVLSLSSKIYESNMNILKKLLYFNLSIPFNKLKVNQGHNRKWFTKVAFLC